METKTFPIKRKKPESPLQVALTLKKPCDSSEEGALDGVVVSLVITLVKLNNFRNY